MLLAIANAILPILAAMQSVELPRLLTVDEAAEFLGLARNTVYINARAGLIPHFKVGAAVRFDLHDLRAWLESNRRGPKVATDG